MLRLSEIMINKDPIKCQHLWDWSSSLFFFFYHADFIWLRPHISQCLRHRISTVVSFTTLAFTAFSLRAVSVIFNKPYTKKHINPSSQPVNTSSHFLPGMLQWEFVECRPSRRPPHILHGLKLQTLQFVSSLTRRLASPLCHLVEPCLQDFLFPHQICLCVSSWWEHCGRQRAL